MTADGLLVRVATDPSQGYQSVGLYRHAQDIAQPGGTASTEFVLTEHSTELNSHRAVFENPRHDYPKRIVYERSPPRSASRKAAAPGASCSSRKAAERRVLAHVDFRRALLQGGVPGTPPCRRCSRA